MASYSTAEEVEQEHLGAFGPELGPIYHQLYNECAWLNVFWQQYVTLFGDNEHRIDLLNQSAGLFFRIVQDTMWADALLSLARLTDPPVSPGGKANLTIQRLPDCVHDDSVRPEVERLVELASQATAFARDWRNRHIAHRDLALAVDEGATPLAKASREQVREAIDAICRVLRRVHLYRLGSDLRLDLVSTGDDAEGLLYVIRDGLEAAEAQRQRLLHGKPLPDDLRPPRAV